MSAPLFATASAARHARALHPRGLVFEGHIEAVDAPADDGLRLVAERLVGPVLVRFSPALWKNGGQRPDVLGCAVRLLGGTTRPDRDAGTSAAEDQDLLFATIRSPWTMPIAPFLTRVDDFLANEYFATAPFDVPALGRAKLKLVPAGLRVAGDSREDKLRDAVESNRATLVMQVRKTWTSRYHPVARIRLERASLVDQEALRFDPFRTGRGIVPRGFVQSLRRGAYSGSQATRSSGR